MIYQIYSQFVCCRTMLPAPLQTVNQRLVLRVIILAVATVFFLTAFIINITSNQSMYNATLELVPKLQNNPTLGSSAFIDFMNIISNIFNPVICAGYILIFYLISARKLEILVFLIWFIFLSFLLSILKQLLQQARPYWISNSGVKMLEWTCYTEYGLPSGHSMLGLILMQFVLRFFARSYKCIAKYIGLFYLLILILQLLVMFSRVILGMHSINQVLFGAIIGMYSFIPYYLFVEKWLLNRFVSLFGASKDLPLMTISISIMLTITLELLITLIPVYNIVDYISVINATNGCQKIKQAKSFQYKCFEDSSLLMAAYGTLIGFLFLQKPANLIKSLNYPRASIKFFKRFFLTIIIPLIPVGIFLNPGWASIDLPSGNLAVLIWSCQTLGFFISMFLLIKTTSRVNTYFNLQHYYTPQSKQQFLKYQTINNDDGKCFKKNRETQLMRNLAVEQMQVNNSNSLVVDVRND